MTDAARGAAGPRTVTTCGYRSRPARTLWSFDSMRVDPPLSSFGKTRNLFRAARGFGTASSLRRMTAPTHSASRTSSSGSAGPATSRATSLGGGLVAWRSAAPGATLAAGPPVRARRRRVRNALGVARIVGRGSGSQTGGRALQVVLQRFRGQSLEARLLDLPLQQFRQAAVLGGWSSRSALAVTRMVAT